MSLEIVCEGNQHYLHPIARAEARLKGPGASGALSVPIGTHCLLLDGHILGLELY